MSPGRKPADLGKPGCPPPHPQPSPAGHSPRQEGTASIPEPAVCSTPVSLPRPPHDPLPAGRVKGASGAAPRALAPLDPATRSHARLSILAHLRTPHAAARRACGTAHQEEALRDVRRGEISDDPYAAVRGGQRAVLV